MSQQNHQDNPLLCQMKNFITEKNFTNVINF